MSHSPLKEEQLILVRRNRAEDGNSCGFPAKLRIEITVTGLAELSSLRDHETTTEREKQESSPWGILFVSICKPLRPYIIDIWSFHLLFVHENY